MARISYDTFQETAASTSRENNDGIKLFSLKNDGDEAVVRIMHDSVADFDIITTHPVKIGERYRKVSCIRDPREPMDNCPLCKSGVKIQQRFYIHMLQYTKDENGQVVVKPVVWERAAGEYATKFKTLIDEYGPLSDSIFKIRRNGKAGDMSTTYEILYGNPSIYRADLYPKDVNAFAGYSALGKIVMDRTFEEIAEFLATGNFPMRQRGNTTVNEAVPTAVEVPYVPTVPTTGTAVPNNGGYVPTTTTPVPSVVPGSGVPTTPPNTYGAPATAPTSRPTRYY